MDLVTFTASLLVERFLLEATLGPFFNTKFDLRPKVRGTEMLKGGDGHIPVIMAARVTRGMGLKYFAYLMPGLFLSGK